jgi:hypothetical protein
MNPRLASGWAVEYRKRSGICRETPERSHGANHDRQPNGARPEEDDFRARDFPQVGSGAHIPGLGYRAESQHVPLEALFDAAQTGGQIA